MSKKTFFGPDDFVKQPMSAATTNTLILFSPVIRRGLGEVVRRVPRTFPPLKHRQPQKKPAKKDGGGVSKQQDRDRAAIEDDHPLVNRAYSRNPNDYYT